MPKDGYRNILLNKDKTVALDCGTLSKIDLVAFFKEIKCALLCGSIVNLWCYKGLIIQERKLKI